MAGTDAPGAGKSRVHAVSFAEAPAALAAVRRLRAEGFEVHDVHTPFPVHGLDEALGLRPSRLGRMTFAGGVLGAAAAFGFQVWTHAVDWPLVIGGKTPLALPAQVPVSFELTVLFAALFTVFGLLARRRLFPRIDGRPADQPHPRVTDDRFVVLVVERDAGFAPARFGELVTALGAVERAESWRAL